MNVREGIEIADGAPVASESNDINSDAGFNAFLTGKADQGNTPAEPSKHRDPAIDTPEEIVGGLFSPEMSTTVREGLTTSSPKEPDFTIDWNRPGLREAVEHGQRLNEAEAEELRLGREAREAIEVGQFLREVLPVAATTEQIAAGLAELRSRISEDSYLELSVVLARELAGLEGEGELDDDEDVELYLTAQSELDQGVELAEAKRQLRHAIGMETKLAPVVAKQERDGQKAEITSWVRDRGYRPQDARARLELIDDVVFEQTGVRLEAVADRKQFSAYLRAADSVLCQWDRQHSDRAIVEGVLNAETARVADGYERWTDRGYRKMNEVQLPPVLLDPDQTAKHAISKRASAKDIREAVLEGNPRDTRSGLTQAGRPTTFDVASGEKERRDQAERDRRNSYGVGR
jgi:hypothetical protein